jgi:two-component system, NarL family, sensor histidine kinase UhpB
VTVADDGCGFDVHSTVQRALRSDRLGLAGLHERVLLLGGTLDLAARIGEGVVVCATLPRWRPLEPRRDTPYTSTAA